MKGMGRSAAKYPSETRKGAERCKRIVAFMASCYEANRRPPSIREIGKEIGVPSPGLVSYYLNRLKADGILSRSYNTARSVMLVQAPA